MTQSSSKIFRFRAKKDFFILMFADLTKDSWQLQRYQCGSLQQNRFPAAAGWDGVVIPLGRVYGRREKISCHHRNKRRPLSTQGYRSRSSTKPPPGSRGSGWAVGLVIPLLRACGRVRRSLCGLCWQQTAKSHKLYRRMTTFTNEYHIE